MNQRFVFSLYSSFSPNVKMQAMKSLSTQIKHAKITSREVFIHLRKNGGLKRKNYKTYLKMQYRVAGSTYQNLQSVEDNFECNPKHLNNKPTEKKLTMPVHLCRSELSLMSKSFNDTCFLTEAWHFFLKEKMKSIQLSPALVSVNEKPGISDLQTENQLVTSKELYLNGAGTFSNSTINNTLREIPQSHIKLDIASGFENQNRRAENSGRPSSLCAQILEWAKEGKLILN